jgi:hypothetical protein
VVENPLPRLGRIIVNRLPKGIGRDLVRLSIFGHHVNDADADGAELAKELRDSRDHRSAALGG